MIDTSAYSRLRGGDPRVLDRMAAATLVLLPTIVLGELEAAATMERAATLVTFDTHFAGVRGLACEILPVDA